MKRFLGKWKWAILGGFGVILLAFGLRVYNLTALPIFADEAIYVRWAQVMRAESTLRFLPLSDGKQPLYMWAVIPFLKLISDPLFAGRFLSVVSGMGTLTGIFLLSYYLFRSYRLSLIASFLYAVSPFSVFFDRMALADAMLAMFGIWTLLLGTLAARTKRLDFAMLTGFALGGALLTKSPGIFFAILLPVSWLILPWPKSRKEKAAHLAKAFFLLLITYLISLGMYNILRLGPNFNMIGSRNQDYVFPLSHLWTNPKDPFQFLLDRSFEWIKMMGPWEVLVLGLVGLLGNLGKHKKEITLLLAWFLIPILVQSEFAKVFTARYILFTMPYLFIIAGAAFLTRTTVIRWLTAGVLAVFVSQAFIFDYYLLTDPAKANLPRSERSGYLEEWTAGYGIKESADYIRAQAMERPERKIVVGTEGYFGTLPDGMEMYLNDLKDITVIGTGLNFVTLPDSLFNSKRAGNLTYLVVNKSRFNGKEKDLGLTLVAAYPKAIRPEGIKEYNVFGPQDALYLFEVTK